MNNLYQLTVEFTDGWSSVGFGEVIFRPEERSIYLLGDDGTHTVYNFDRVKCYEATPVDEVSLGDDDD